MKESIFFFAFLMICAVCPLKVIAEENTNKQEMVMVKGGCFEMGCGRWAGDCNGDNEPVHEVCIDDFYIDKYEVTQKAYWEETGTRPSKFWDCENCPVEQINWFEALNYCKRAGKRLPTEAEWEYSARGGGLKEKYAGTNDDPNAYLWYYENSGNRTHPVGQKLPNRLGLHDMSGNVSEWVADLYEGDYYGGSPRENPPGPLKGRKRVLRGGSWYYQGYIVRTTDRAGAGPFEKDFDLGFRCARNP